jgi:hypothetical protein
MIGYQTDEFPAFYSQSSGIKIPLPGGDSVEIARIAKQHWRLGMKGHSGCPARTKETNSPGMRWKPSFNAPWKTLISWALPERQSPLPARSGWRNQCRCHSKSKSCTFGKQCIAAARIASSFEPQKGTTIHLVVMDLVLLQLASWYGLVWGYWSPYALV